MLSTPNDAFQSWQPEWCKGSSWSRSIQCQQLYGQHHFLALLLQSLFMPFLQRYAHSVHRCAQAWTDTWRWL